jgi:hypothetical protein
MPQHTKRNTAPLHERVSEITQKSAAVRERSRELAAANRELVATAERHGRAGRRIIADLARARYRRYSYPDVELSEALTRAGLPIEEQERRALRGFIHCKSGSPPPDHANANTLAQIVLELIDDEQEDFTACAA